MPAIARPLGKRIRKAMLKQLSKTDWGSITITEGKTTQTLGNKTAGPQVNVTIHDNFFYPYMAFGGSVGAGQSYFLGLWDTDNLVDLIRIVGRTQDHNSNFEGGLARLSQPLYRAFHKLRENTQANSKKNISAHYDLGNDLFELMLDDTMMYSSAMYTPDTDTLEAAQQHKLHTICQRLDLQPTDHLVEIGTGWGGMAIHAAKHYGCKVTTTTISNEQHALAAERIQAAGLADRITLLKQDYRELEGRFDKLVSIEMIEAVGHEYYETYFEKIGTLLKPGGKGLIQAITTPDQNFERDKNSVDFINRFIFPGGRLPSIKSLLDANTKASNMKLVFLDDFGADYAPTLQEWRKRFFVNIDKVNELGYQREFIRMWEFYLAACEALFADRHCGVAHLVFEKPEC